MNKIVSAEDTDGSVSDHHIHYSSHTIEEDGGATVEEVSAVPPLEISINDSSQLTLSFRGQVYVFDAVTPDKVQAVLLLLGGNELTSGSQCAELSSRNQTGEEEYPAKCSLPHRAASLNRFRQKRKERCFDKKVRYSVRQEVALRSESDSKLSICSWNVELFLILSYFAFLCFSNQFRLKCLLGILYY